MTKQADTYENAGKRLARFILFGNYFLGLCIAALSYETTVKNNVPINGLQYYALAFLFVIVYYTHAYRQDSDASTGTNPRSQWYHNNRKLISGTQTVYTILIISSSISLLKSYASSFVVLPLPGWLLLFIFPITALLYYGIVFPAARHVQLRTVAWLKPFIIGFVCTGCIVIYPMIFSALQQQADFHITTAVVSYFLTNWLFTTAIAIMFDIKDFAADHNYHLKTFVVAKGLRYTIFFILLPLSVFSILSFLVFAALEHFSLARIIINLIPFILLFFAASSLRRRRGILYYLLIIDGLLLVKALFGIAAMTFVK